jgi:hypothetical protein
MSEIRCDKCGALLKAGDIKKEKCWKCGEVVIQKVEKDLFIKPNYSLSPFDRFMPGGSTIKTRFSRNKSAKNDDIIFPKRYKDDSDKIVFGVSMGGAHSNLLSKELTK